MNPENREDKVLALHVEFRCGSGEHARPIAIPVHADALVDENLKWFITEHTHNENGSALAEHDRTALYSVLSKFFNEELPKISEIMMRRKLTFGFEINPGNPR